jgi:hypothetical protein
MDHAAPSTLCQPLSASSNPLLNVISEVNSSTFTATDACNTLLLIGGRPARFT